MKIDKWLVWGEIIFLPLVFFAGGKPSRGTPADKRLAGNKPKPTMRPKPAPKKGKS